MVEQLDATILGTVDEKGFVPDDTRNAFFRKLRMKSDNRSCFECNNRNPTWISLTYGVYLCLECSGEHRRKGVHLSFVRSVELDRFTPEQMVQMAVGGNAKAWEHFKQSGMGKTSDTGRAVDYNSKVAQRYKQNMEAATAELCAKFGVKSKEERSASSASPSPVASASPPAASKAAAPAAANEFSDFGFDATSAAVPPAPTAMPRGASAPAAPASAVMTNSYPKATPSAPAAPPSTVKVLRAVSESSKEASTSSSAVPKPSGFAAKQKAKELDFDFDFDSLEQELSKPAPAPAAKAASAPAAAAPAPGKPMFAPSPAPTRAPAAAASSDSAAKFTNKKGISSDDYFQDERNETAAAKMEREGRYNKFAAAGAISSDAFFGGGEEPGETRRTSSGELDWGDLASKGSDMAKKGADMLVNYINKARN
mmetsp:Transcript_16117/g.34827  ORF Transcript_16117/g.34827 Transcript_16117/m.34827 type:complete len:425 (+) Transcript_16117:118-1392(+)